MPQEEHTQQQPHALALSTLEPAPPALPPIGASSRRAQGGERASSRRSLQEGVQHTTQFLCRKHERLARSMQRRHVFSKEANLVRAQATLNVALESSLGDVGSERHTLALIRMGHAARRNISYITTQQARATKRRREVDGLVPANLTLAQRTSYLLGQLEQTVSAQNEILSEQDAQLTLSLARQRAALKERQDREEEVLRQKERRKLAREQHQLQLQQQQQQQQLQQTRDVQDVPPEDDKEAFHPTPPKRKASGSERGSIVE